MTPTLALAETLARTLLRALTLSRCDGTGVAALVDDHGNVLNSGKPSHDPNPDPNPNPNPNLNPDPTPTLTMTLTPTPTLTLTLTLNRTLTLTLTLTLTRLEPQRRGAPDRPLPRTASGRDPLAGWAADGGYLPVEP